MIILLAFIVIVEPQAPSGSFTGDNQRLNKFLNATWGAYFSEGHSVDFPFGNLAPAKDVSQTCAFDGTYLYVGNGTSVSKILLDTVRLFVKDNLTTFGFRTFQCSGLGKFLLNQQAMTYCTIWVSF